MFAKSTGHKKTIMKANGAETEHMLTDENALHVRLATNIAMQSTLASRANGMNDGGLI